MGKFKAIETPIKGLLVVEPTVFGDARGFFMETYAQRDFEEIGIFEQFVQDNHSKSRKGVLRGMHFQRQHTQGKLVRVTAGAAYDAVVDLRPESPTYGQWFGEVLSAENKLMLYVPPRFAHGFLTLEDGTEFLYKCTDYYDPTSDSGIMWNDPAVGIEWPLAQYGIDPAALNISDKDKKHLLIGQLDKNNIWQ